MPAATYRHNSRSTLIKTDLLCKVFSAFSGSALSNLIPSNEFFSTPRVGTPAHNVGRGGTGGKEYPCTPRLHTADVHFIPDRDGNSGLFLTLPRTFSASDGESAALFPAGARPRSCSLLTAPAFSGSSPFRPRPGASRPPPAGPACSEAGQYP